jgi:hypothetical protein
MTAHTPDELRAALEDAARNDGASFRPYAATIRAMLESFDEEQAFLEAARNFFNNDVALNDVPMSMRGQSSLRSKMQRDRANARAAYRALVAKREGVSK